LPTRDLQGLSAAMLAATLNASNPMIVISADAQASHQSVMLVLEAARRSGLTQLTFAAQSSGTSD